MSLRSKIAAGAVALAIGVGTLGVAAPAAHASNLLNVPHIHIAGCTQSDCWTWITADGTVWRGNSANLTAQYNYVLVVCSQHYANNYWHISNLGQWGPYGNDGAYHPYCVNPADAGGNRWNTYPKTASGL